MRYLLFVLNNSFPNNTEKLRKLKSQNISKAVSASRTNVTAFPVGQLDISHDRKLKKKKQKLLTGIVLVTFSPGKYEHVECFIPAWRQEQNVRSVNTEEENVTWGWTVIKGNGIMPRRC